MEMNSNVIISQLLGYYIICLQCGIVLCQVCVETKMYYRDVPETFLYTYMEAYEKSDCLFWCTDTRVATAIGTRNVRKLIPQQINVCCEGYTKDESDHNNSIHCKPLCSDPCINGYCKSPGVCACNPGYIPDSSDAHKCLPLCIMGCEHGTCTAPETCQCDSGYELLNGVCEPVCSEPCYNGSCVTPENCQCLPGYKKSKNNTCELYCSSYTASGECINTTVCEPGWTKVTKEQVEVCEPVCSECVNGNCVAPQTCECLIGFKMSVNESCEPYCSSGCLHGSCISPETCICDPGWYRKESRGECLAHCDYNCGNGTCVAPNICECFPGYELDELMVQEEKDRALCIPVCTNCEGTCVSPGKCVCELPQEIMLVGIDGAPCDCLDNCTENDKKCEKTICLLTTTTTEASEFTSDDNIEDTTTFINVFSTNVAVDDTTVDSSERVYNELNIEKASWFNSNWFYAIGSTTLLLIIIIIIMVAAAWKRRYSKSLNSNIFQPQSSNSEIPTSVYYKQNA